MGLVLGVSPLTRMVARFALLNHSHESTHGYTLFERHASSGYQYRRTASVGYKLTDGASTFYDPFLARQDYLEIVLGHNEVEAIVITVSLPRQS